MTFIITLITIIQSFSISLGVGSSTLAIVNFFAAIADGTIDETERRMMGIVYVVLRIAMVAILVSTLMLFGLKYLETQSFSLTGVELGQITALAVLYINAILMTKRIMPSTYGPALQAGSWYTLGTLSALQIVGIVGFVYWEFVLSYITWLVAAVAIVNGVMAIQKSRRAEQ